MNLYCSSLSIQSVQISYSLPIKRMQKLWHAQESDFCTRFCFEKSQDIIHIRHFTKSKVNCKIKHSKCDEFNDILLVCHEPTL